MENTQEKKDQNNNAQAPAPAPQTPKNEGIDWGRIGEGCLEVGLYTAIAATTACLIGWGFNKIVGNGGNTADDTVEA